ncbi:hypothetical protein, partial [Megalodesulfovibrio gigas]
FWKQALTQGAHSRRWATTGPFLGAGGQVKVPIQSLDPVSPTMIQNNHNDHVNNQGRHGMIKDLLNKLSRALRSLFSVIGHILQWLDSKKAYFPKDMSIYEIISDIFKKTLVVALLIVLIIYRNDILGSLKGSGIQKLTLAGTTLEFTTASATFRYFSLPANQYWLDPNIDLTKDSTYVIKASGLVNTGSLFQRGRIPGDTCNNETVYLISRIEHNIAQRHPNGSLTHPEYIEIVNNNNACHQIASDLLRVAPHYEYGTLLVGFFTDDEIENVRRNPWRHAHSIVACNAALKLEVRYKGSKVSIGGDTCCTKVNVPGNGYKMFFIVNDSVIPDIFTQKYGSQPEKFLQDMVIRFNELKTRKSDALMSACTDHKIREAARDLFKEPFALPRLVEQNTTVAFPGALGSRDFWYHNNQGHFSILIEEQR